jgi:hypothetical protein
MAKVRLSSLISHISGSIGSATYQNTKQGYIVRSKPIPRNPNSQLQLFTRNIMAQLVAAWASASLATKQLYQNALIQGKWKGEVSQLPIKNARQLFIAFNYFRLYNNLPILSTFTAPVYYAYYQIDIIRSVGGFLQVEFTSASGATDANIMFNFYVSQLDGNSTSNINKVLPTRQLQMVRVSEGIWRTVLPVSTIFFGVNPINYNVYYIAFFALKNYPASFPIYAEYNYIDS